MKPDSSQQDKLKEAQNSVEFAHYKLIINAAAPYWGIRERILKKAKVFVPAEIPDEYRNFLETQFGLIVETPHLYEEYQAVFNKIESEVWESLGDKGTKLQRKKISDFFKKKGPLKLLKELWPALMDLRYEYFTESALKLLKRADLNLKKGSIFKDSTILTSAFHFAMDRDDLSFFAHVGDVLNKRQVDINSVMSKLTRSKLEDFLVKHWVKNINGVPPLFNLSISQLTDICCTHMGVTHLTEDSVDKTRKRLGLKTFRRALHK